MRLRQETVVGITAAGDSLKAACHALAAWVVPRPGSIVPSEGP